MRARVLGLTLLSASACTKNTTKTPTIAPLNPCTADGQVDCLTTDAFVGVVKASIAEKVGEIKAGTTIGGVAGSLAACSTDNGTNCSTSAEYPSVVKSAITAGGIKSGLVVAGVTGTFAPVCTLDGQVDCLTTSSIKAGDTSLINAFDVRAGRKAAGYTAKLAFNRNASDTSVFNRTVGAGAVASGTVADYYDSIDDQNNGGAFPTTVPAIWLALSDNWRRDSASDTDANGQCNAAEECVYTDLVTGISWGRSNGTSQTWENAIAACDGFAWGTYNDWRVPTQKELFQAYIDGIYSLKTPLNITDFGYQSATTLGLDTSSVYYIVLSNGQSTSVAKTTTTRFICVR